MKIFKSTQKIIHLDDFTQLLAFNFDNQIARYQYIQQAQGDVEQYIVVDQKQIKAVILVTTEERIPTVINGFIRRGFSKQVIFDAFSTYFQAKRWPGVKYTLISNWDEHYLLQRGFTVNGTNFEKIYEYPKFFVFGGGGAHGAFQTGAFDALTTAGIIPDAMIGVSVGAITAMSLMHLNSQTAHDVWDKLTTERVYGVPEIGLNRQQFTKTMVNQLISRDFKSKQYLLDLFLPVATKELDQPKIKFSLLTTNVKTMVPKVVTVDETMDPLTLSKWVVASSAFFPVVSPIEIDGELYIDGGYSNDIPVNEAIAQGAKDIYVIDIQGMGRSQRYKVPKEVKIHWIKTVWDLGPILDFVPDKSRINMVLGELEVQKFLGQLSGIRYFFEIKPHLGRFDWKNLVNEFAIDEFTQKFIKLFNNPFLEYLLRNKIAKFTKQKVSANHLSGQAMVEYICSLLEINPACIYTEQSLLTAIVQAATVDNLIDKFKLPDDDWNTTYLYQHPEVLLIAIIKLICIEQKMRKDN